MAAIAFVDGSVFNPLSGDVRQRGALLRLEPQPAAILALLASRPGELVGHDEIRRAVWGDGTHVNFQEGLHYAIRQIRLTFQDSARAPWLIETMPRRGYRLLASAIQPVAAPATRLTVGASRRVSLVCCAAGLVLAMVLLERRPNNHHQLAVAVVQTVHGWLF